MPAQDVANISMVSAPNLGTCGIARNILRLKPKTSTNQITIMEAKNGMVDLLAGGITFCGYPLGSPCTQRTIGGFVMREVKRHVTWFPSEIGGDMLESVVRASDYDAAQSELAALREDLATAKKLLNQASSMVNGATDEWHSEVQKFMEVK